MFIHVSQDALMIKYVEKW